MTEVAETAGAPEEVPLRRPSLRKITVKEFIDPRDLKHDLAYTMADLTDAMMRQASMFAHYGVLASQASRQVDNMKMLLEVTEAKVYRTVSDAAARAGNKITEAKLEKMVAVHEQVIEVKKALNEAKQIEANAKTAVEAFRHRRDMLVQQGLISREEMKGEVSISRKRAHEEALEEQKARALERLKEKAE